jgi:hypothetical protein
VGWFGVVGTDADRQTITDLLAAEQGTTAAPQGPYEVHVGVGLARTDVRSAPRAVHHPDGTLSLAPHEPAGS